MSRLFCILLLISTTSLSSTVQDDDDDDGDIAGPPISDEEFRESENIPDVFEEPEVNPEELAGLFEGDIVLDPVKNGSKFRNAIRPDQKWPGAVIPYVISRWFTELQRKLIGKAMKIYHEKTCIRFKPRTNERDYIYIMKGKGCSSHIGKTGGGQPLVLSDQCFQTGTILHEFMHAAGFYHEQSRTDRDRYVDVQWANIYRGDSIDSRINFKKYKLSSMQLLGPYDICSIMHYSQYGYSKNGEPTLIPLRQPTECDDIGQRNDLSYLDIKKLNTLYQCEGLPQLSCEDNIDFSDWCEEKARKGMCNDFQLQTFMTKNCKKSCNVCRS